MTREQVERKKAQAAAFSQIRHREKEETPWLEIR